MTRSILPDTEIPAPSAIDQRIAKLERILSGYIAQPGDLIPSAARIRAGCLLCDGSTYLASTYPELAAACPDYVSGGVITVPDSRGRSLIGSGTGTASGATAHALGSTPTSGAGGEETHLLTGPESGVQQHSHDSTLVGGGGNSANVTVGGGGYGLRGTGPAGPANATNAHNIMQPITAINWFIKY